MICLPDVLQTDYSDFRNLSDFCVRRNPRQTTPYRVDAVCLKTGYGLLLSRLAVSCDGLCPFTVNMHYRSHDIGIHITATCIPGSAGQVLRHCERGLACVSCRCFFINYLGTVACRCVATTLATAPVHMKLVILESVGHACINHVVKGTFLSDLRHAWVGTTHSLMCKSLHVGCQQLLWLLCGTH